MFRVVNVLKATVVVHDYDHSVQNIMSSVLAEKLAEIEPERLAPERRARLNSTLEAQVRAETAEIGVETKWIRFTAFVLNPKTIRLLTETAPFNV
jgi:regulator of protease activity HflC (stomatin/prohibitin superfamily)